jgi:hypothetical protein
VKLHRLNSRPIIVNGFSRGGTGILMNLLLSHPDTAAPSGELQAVFKGGKQEGEENPGRVRYKKFFYDRPIRFLNRQDIFNMHLFEPRDIPNRFVLKYIDWILFHEKLRALGEFKNLWKDPTTLYTKEELAKSRLTFKAFDGLVFTNDIFRIMYPDVRFVAVIRNGFAVCEGHIRRGFTPERAANEYIKTGEEIIRNLSNPDYLCVKFEDILCDPFTVIQKILSHCGLDITKCKYFRLKNKPTISEDGKPVLRGDGSRLVWYTPEELKKHFILDVNQNQISRLTENEISYLDKTIGPVMQKFNYL